ncbi:glycosyltransferase [Cellulomonas endophytica]|uniref:glycosyltransferase n=1 Tax=Cellulomonas endophytica TaxID=2494735 RepID=UPI00101278FC|nr:glycosyltransferase [Cellulomonas endophytica]
MTRREQPRPTPKLLYVTWHRHGGRVREISSALGADALHIRPVVRVKRLHVTVQRSLSVLVTVRELVRRRPDVVLVTNPPALPGVLVAAVSRLLGARFVLDNHPGSFGDKDNAGGRRAVPVTRRLARAALVVLVNNPEYVRVVEGWGGRATIVHEGPPESLPPVWEPRPGARTRVLVPAVFDVDEPVDVVAEVARRMPDHDFVMTGERGSAPASLRDALPANLELLGFLGPEPYEAELAACDVVLALTTAPRSVQRSAYEAVYAGRPLVCSDFPFAREYFPYAHHAHNEPDAVVRALETAVRDAPETLLTARKVQAARWDEQIGELRRLVGLPVTV